jgi:hypothetical protein
MSTRSWKGSGKRASGVLVRPVRGKVGKRRHSLAWATLVVFIVYIFTDHLNGHSLVCHAIAMLSRFQAVFPAVQTVHIQACEKDGIESV